MKTAWKISFGMDGQVFFLKMNRKRRKFVHYLPLKTAILFFWQKKKLRIICFLMNSSWDLFSIISREPTKMILIHELQLCGITTGILTKYLLNKFIKIKKERIWFGFTTLTCYLHLFISKEQTFILVLVFFSMHHFLLPTFLKPFNTGQKLWGAYCVLM